jgi:hypothetical protein
MGYGVNHIDKREFLSLHRQARQTMLYQANEIKTTPDGTGGHGGTAGGRTAAGTAPFTAYSGTSWSTDVVVSAPASLQAIQRSNLV